MKSNYIKNLNRSAYLPSPKDNIQIPFYHKNVLRENVASLTHVCWRVSIALAEIISMKAYRLCTSKLVVFRGRQIATSIKVHYIGGEVALSK